MKQVSIGASRLQARVPGLGCMGMSWAYEPHRRDDAASRDFLNSALDAGVNFLDTADVYGPFHNESLIGDALSGRRSEFVLATKAGLVAEDETSIRRDGRPEHLRAALEASLLRLRTDHVDLYQLHRVDPDVPLVESWGALAELVAEGKVREIGLSEVSVAEIRQAHAIHPVASVQSELSLWTRQALTDVLPYTESQGIVFIAFSPIGRGFLANTVTSNNQLAEGDWRRTLPRFQQEKLAQNRVIAERIAELADGAGVTAAQLSLAWVLHQGEHVLPIPGTKTPQYLADNMAAADITLSDATMAALAALPEPAGSRY